LALISHDSVNVVFHGLTSAVSATVIVECSNSAACCWFVFQSELSFDYSLERVIDDWVLMGFLVGNDFIPHLPHIHIHQDCLPLLWQTYKTILPTLDGLYFSL